MNKQEAIDMLARMIYKSKMNKQTKKDCKTLIGIISGKEVNVEPIRRGAELIEVKDFRRGVESTCFTEYDGYGYYSDGRFMYGVVDLSCIKRKKYSYVAWFNR